MCSSTSVSLSGLERKWKGNSANKASRSSSDISAYVSWSCLGLTGLTKVGVCTLWLLRYYLGLREYFFHFLHWIHRSTKRRYSRYLGERICFLLKGLHRLRPPTPWIFFFFLYFLGCSPVVATTLLHQCDGRFFQVWRKVFPLWNEFKAQRELGAWLTIKLGKTRLKWQLACGEEPSLLSRSGIRPLTGTAVDKTD